MMNRLLSPFILTITAMLAAGYSYVSARLAGSAAMQLALALPFLAVWVVPVFYWGSDRDRHGAFHQAVHYASYVSMGWLSFLVLMCAIRDLVLLATSAAAALINPLVPPLDIGVVPVFGASLVMLASGLIAAFAGPRIRRVDIPVPGLAPGLHGYRIVQISDLHVGLTIRERYVRRVVELTKSLAPDLIAITGDVVDGPVARLRRHVEALRELPGAAPSFFVHGNHDYYSGAAAWTKEFAAMGLRVLMNEAAMVTKGNARLLVAGVTDPAARIYDPARAPRIDSAAGAPVDFRLLLAHNPKLAPAGAKGGYDLQLSGHTHAGQFFPWTLAVRLVHAPHVAGLSREGSMWVYVSAGTGTWGPPVRFGTTPELTLLRLMKSEQ